MEAGPKKELKRREFPELRKMAAELIKRHPEMFKAVPPLSDILFVLDPINEPTSKGAAVLARVSKIQGKVVDFVYDGDKTWMLEWFSRNNGYMTLNQSYVLLAHELLHFEIGPNGHRLRGHDVEEFLPIAERFGLKWTSPTIGDVPDILAPDFTWGRQGQARLRFDEALPQIAAAVAQAVPGTEVTVSAGGKEATAKADLAVLAAEMVGHFGVDGAKAIVETVRDAKTAGNVIPLRPSTGTDS